MSHLGGFAVAEVQFPGAGAWRLHHQPLEVFHRPEPRDRFDDPENRYLVRYFATTIRGVMLEVLNHFRRNDEAETALSEVQTIGIDLLEEEPAGSVPEKWLSSQCLVRATAPEFAAFVDVDHPRALALLNRRTRVRQALSLPAAIKALGTNATLDQATIKLAGPVGRPITQAVSREIYEAHSSASRDYVGIAYTTRFDRSEPCWAVFDDHVALDWDSVSLLNVLDPTHLQPINDVAQLYDLELPPNWKL